MFGFGQERHRKRWRSTNETPSPPPLGSTSDLHVRAHELTGQRADDMTAQPVASGNGVDKPNRSEVPRERLALLAERIGVHLSKLLGRYQEAVVAELNEIARVNEATSERHNEVMAEKLGAVIAAGLDRLSGDLHEALDHWANALLEKATAAVLADLARHWSALEQRLTETCSTTAQRAIQRPVIDALLALHDRVHHEALFQSIWYRKDAELTLHVGCRQLQERADSASHSYAAEILRILQSLGVQPIIGSGGKFNPHHQRAVDVEMTSQPELDGHVARIVRAGFTWHGSILRSEEVIVFKLERKNHEREN